MYLDFFGLKEEPFNLTPDSHFLYLSEQHRKALVLVKYGIEQKKGFIALTGEVGSGKTTVCRSLMKMLDREKIETALILNSFVSSHNLLKMICEDLEIPSGGDKEALVDRLNRFLLDQREKEKTVVIIIDECQNLSFEVLEQIRMLSNIETEKEKLLQIVLIGQPEFLEKLSTHELRQLNQRITVRAHLNPLSLEECRDYILHRLKVAGSDGSISFTPGAIKAIYRFCGGIPRRINIICDYALIAGYVRETRTITEGMVRNAIKEIHIKREVGLKQRLDENIHLKRKVIRTAAYSFCLFSLMAAAWIYRLPVVSFWSTLYRGFVSGGLSARDVFSRKLLARAVPVKEVADNGKSVKIRAEEMTPLQEKAEGPFPASGPEEGASPASDSKEEFIDIQIKGNISLDDIPDGTRSTDLPAWEDKISAEAQKDSAVPAALEKGTGKDMLGGLPPEQKALWLLLSTWGIDYRLSDKEKDKDPDMKAVVQKLNYDKAEIWEGLDYLLKLNLPFATEMKTGDYWLIYKVENSQMFFKRDPSSEERIDRKDFLLEWKGKSIVILEKRATSLSLDRTYCRGDRDEDIIKVKKIFQEIGYGLSDSSDLFDIECEDIVKDFQKSFMLFQDGMVGPETSLMLYSRLEKYVPRLYEQ